MHSISLPITLPHFRLGALALALSLAVPAAGQSAQLLADVNQSVPLGSFPSEFVELNGDLVFAATTSGFGRELWRYDRSSDTASLVADLRAGPDDGNPQSLTAWNGEIWFVAADASGSGVQLWKTDGTTAGTQLAAPQTWLAAGLLTPAGGRLFFFAEDAATGRELWTTDLSTGTTSLVRDVFPGPISSNPRNLTPWQGQLYFTARDNSSGSEVWRTDGTAAGTVLATDIHSPTTSITISDLTRTANWLLFRTNAGLWRTDGTSVNTTLVYPSPWVLNPLEMPGEVWFSVGADVFSTDGSSVQLVGTAPAQGTSVAAVTGLERLGTEALAVVTYQLGLAAIHLVRFAHGAAPTVLNTEFQGQLHVGPTRGYFTAFEAGLGIELWTTDGTAAGTIRLTDLIPGPRSIGSVYGAVLSTDELVCSLNDFVHGSEPWISDGSPTGTRLLADLEVNRTADSNPSQFVEMGGAIYFAASDGRVPRLCKSDGTAAGTIIMGAQGGLRPQNPQELTPAGDKLFFVAEHPQQGRELWVSDGTAAGTRVVVDLSPGFRSTDPTNLVAVGNRVYFQTYPRSAENELFVSDGTAAGTVQLTNLSGHVASRCVPFRGGVLFSCYEWSQGHEPWFSDGTPGGTVRLFNPPGIISTAPSAFTALGDQGFFIAQNPRTIGFTDGTPAGTGDTRILPDATSFEELTRVGAQLFFEAEVPAFGTELFVSDGTPTGTALVVDLTPGPAGTEITAVGAIGERFVFRAAPASGGPGQLYATDGTAAGTVSLGIDAPAELVASDHRYAWFARTDAASGTEIWRTDGTAAGTILFDDLAPGVDSSDPREFGLAAGRLLFSADLPDFGREPFALDPGATVAEIGYGCSIERGTTAELSGTSPVLGGTLDLTVRFAPESGLGILLLSGPASTSFRLPGGRCDLFVDPAFSVAALAIYSQGSFDLSLPVPSNPALAGLAFRLQSLLVPTQGRAETTNALAVTAGL